MPILFQLPLKCVSPQPLPIFDQTDWSLSKWLELFWLKWRQTFFRENESAFWMWKSPTKVKTDLDPKSNFALLALWSTAWSQTTSNKDSLILHLKSLIGIL